MKISTYLTPVFTENKNNFLNSVCIYIDVLRASTSICYALANDAREIIPAENMDKALSIYSNMSKDIRLLAGEREGIKPTGFQLGNSPREFKKATVSEKSIVLTTTNGTRAMQIGKGSKFRLVASFVNLSSIVNFIAANPIFKSEFTLNIICAGNSGYLSLEDTLCAGKIIHDFEDLSEAELSDSSIAAKELYKSKKDNLVVFLRECEHPKKLIDLGFEQDVLDSLTLNKLDIVPVISGNVIKSLNNS